MFRRLALPTVAVALLACALPAAAGATPTWLPAVDLQPPSIDVAPAYESFGAVARPDGTVVTVASQGGGAGAPTAIEARVRPAGGTFGSPQTLGPVAGATTPLGVLMAVDAAGNVVATWYENAGGVTAIRVAVMEAGTTTFGAGQTLASGSTSILYGVAIAGGTATVVWTASDGANRRVQAAVRPPGGTFGPPATLSDAGQDASAPTVSTGADGTTIVAWQRPNASGYQVVQAAVRPPGGVFGALPNLYTNPGLNSANWHIDGPKVAVAADGRATVLFSVYDNTRHTLYAESRGTNGGFGGLDTVSDSSVDPGGATFSVALDDQNTALAVWSQSGTAVATTRPSGGSFSDTLQPLSQPGGAGTPNVAFAPDGRAVVAWSGLSGTANALQVVARPRGGAFGGPTDLDVMPAADEARYYYGVPSIAIDDQGNTTTFYGTSRDITPGPTTDNRFTYRTATYDAAGPAIGALSVPSSATTASAATMGASAQDRWTTSSLSWSFGDGGTGSGGAVAHTYANPGTYTVTVTATDAVGNATTRSATITVSAAATPGGGAGPTPPTTGPQPLPKFAGKISGTWKAGRTSTTLTSLSVTGVPKGATVTLRCAGGAGKGCRFSRKTVAVAKAGTVSLTKYFNFTKKRGKHKVKVVSRLKPGAVVTVTVTAPGLRGRTYAATVRKRKTPTTKATCLAVGSAATTTSC
jgi:PKD domain